MLKDDGFESTTNDATLSLYSEHGKDVSIFGDDLVRLDWIFVVFAVVHEFKLSLRVSTEGKCYKYEQ